jgi:alkylation response protein AidB-like acyl-CoA dehydrogenase
MSEDVLTRPEDLRLIAESVRGTLERLWPVERHAANLADVGHQRAVWRALSEQGWLSVLDGDDQPGMAEAVVILEEFGRAACPAPLLDVLLTNLALGGTDESARAALDRVRSGAAGVALCLGAVDRDPTAGWVETEQDGDDALLTGQAKFAEAALADVLIVLLDGDRAALVARDAPGVSVVETASTAVPALAEIRFQKARCTVLPLRRTTGRDLLSLVRLGAIARAGGSARRAFELAVDYAKVRKQFGKPIGAFQAIQHKLANMLIWIDASQNLARRAAAAFDARRPEWRYLCDVAFAFGSPMLRRAELEAQHAFGGIAFFEEHELPRHFRRVLVDCIRFGGVKAARLDVARHVLAQAGPRHLPDLDLGRAANEFREELRVWLARNLDPGRDKSRKDLLPYERYEDKDFTRALAAKGWLGVSWPAEHGGQARTAFEQLVFQEELQYVRAPQVRHATGVNFIGPALIRSGTPEQISRFLPLIQQGEATFCLGYSEPEAGSDLGSLRTRADRNGDDWVINGTKHFTSRAERSDFIWLTARTDPASKGAGGVSVFIVPTDAPGVSIHPMVALSRRNANTVFFDDVRVPATALVDEVNRGWTAISAALTAERTVMGGNVASIRLYYDLLVSDLKKLAAEGRPILEDPRTLDMLGEYAAEIEAARALVVQTISVIERGDVPVCEASEAKVFSGELQERLAAAAMDLLGAGAALAEDEPGSLAEGVFEYEVRDGIMHVVGGGTCEIQRSLIATKGLGLPRD